MSETTESLDVTTDPQLNLLGDTVPATSGRGRRGGSGLSGMVLTDLKALAGQLGIKGTSGMRKGDLVAAIAARQNGASAPSATSRPATELAEPSAAETAAVREQRTEAARQERNAAAGSTTEQTSDPSAESSGRSPDGLNGATGHGLNGASTTVDAPAGERPADAGDGPAGGAQDGQPSDTQGGDEGGQRNRRNRRGRRDNRDGGPSASGASDGSAATATDTRPQNDRGERSGQDGQRPQQDTQRANAQDGQRNGAAQNRDTQTRDTQNRQDTRQGQDTRGRDDDDGDGRGRRGRRYRDRNRRGRERFTADSAGPEPEVRDDDVLVPVAGILDVLDSYAFIRTSGYLTGPNDVYVSLSQVRKNGLRRGDAVTGAVRALREGEQQRQKFNALVRLDTVNGLDPEAARNRPEFTKLTPLYPNERLRLETESHILTTRVIDLVMPVGKGQRALIVSPPKAGKTMVMQAIANAITTNNPECHLMVVLVDERPEEVTDMQRSVKGEVIASTFDRPPADHTLVAELSIERAKRLVEMGRDVVVLLDSITRLGRAYNLAAPASGRILSGGVDSTALFPPKRFLGAARNIENGGSLTIFASALVETGSAGDTVIFEEFKGTGNAELKLDRRLSDKRIFPAIDVDQSSTRKEDLLLSPDELAVVVKLRRVLSALDTQQGLELVLDRLRKTRNNIEFLMQVAKTTPGND